MYVGWFSTNHCARCYDDTRNLQPSKREKACIQGRNIKLALHGYQPVRQCQGIPLNENQNNVS